MKRLLMVAFHYPPFSGGSGVHRTLKFSSYLPDFGWQPTVLSADPQAYPQSGVEQLSQIPVGVVVSRAFALDSARHFSICGVYPKVIALPDRWVSWWLGAVVKGLYLISKYRPDVIWSTYPIATAHLIGLTLHRLTGIPWAADFRDSMTEDNYPPDVATRRVFRWIERATVQRADRLIFTTNSTRDMYLTRYPTLCPKRCVVIHNGYDENDFDGIVTREGQNHFNRPIRLLHAGVIYPEERDPRPFFRALSRLKKNGAIHAGVIRVDLRAAGSEAYYSGLLRELELYDLVHLLPSLPYRQSLQDCAEADALLLLQAAWCNHQIPAKTYEYLRLRRPILALTPENSETSALLKGTGGATVIDLADEEALFRNLPDFLDLVRNGRHPLPDEQVSTQYARHNQARDLADCLAALLHR